MVVTYELVLGNRLVTMVLTKIHALLSKWHIFAVCLSPLYRSHWYQALQTLHYRIMENDYINHGIPCEWHTWQLNFQ